MGRRERDRAKAKAKAKRPAWGVPKGIVLLATPEGWRTGVVTAEGGMLCGRLAVPADTDPHDARTAAAAMVRELARDFHATDVEVAWEPPREPWSWTAEVTPVAPDDGMLPGRTGPDRAGQPDRGSSPS
ncbi:hypothetical protein [Streptomyces erythrochromogenes]|uniref:hypothetical protein n=1 Tax=Streptomyces erythrochromogenes TaxID=285574 RepID=UPI00342404E0